MVECGVVKRGFLANVGLWLLGWECLFTTNYQAESVGDLGYDFWDKADNPKLAVFRNTSLIPNQSRRLRLAKFTKNMRFEITALIKPSQQSSTRVLCGA